MDAGNSYNHLISHTAAALTALTFIIAGQARLTTRITPWLSQGKVSNKADTGLDDRKSVLIGIFNLVLAGLLLWRTSRRYAAVVGILLLMKGFSLRWKAGLPVWPPLVTMVGLGMAML